MVGQPTDAGIKKLLKPGANHVEGEPEHHCHDGNKCRNGGETPGEDAVDLLAAGVLAAFMRTHDGLGAHALDEAEAHLGDGGGAVQAALGFHLADDVLKRFALVLIQSQLFKHQLVAFGQLAGGKTQRDTRALGVVLD